MCKRTLIGAVFAVASVLPAQSAQAQAKTHFFKYEYPSESRPNSGGMTRPSQPTTAVAPIEKSPAIVRVILPHSQARVWIADYATVSTGTEREFKSPPIALGTIYMYNLRVAWTESGREILQERTVFLNPGQTTIVDFRQATVARMVVPSASPD
jgi:uncharacterized protein (TIGR03000 family)